MPLDFFLRLSATRKILGGVESSESRGEFFHLLVYLLTSHALSPLPRYRLVSLNVGSASTITSPTISSTTSIAWLSVVNLKTHQRLASSREWR